jgi:cell division protein FtsI (penicillin-binding protein 3)
MESHTGRVVSIVSSERYDPGHITQGDNKKLDPKFGEYPYEAGSVIKPITLAIALEQKKVTPQTWFSVHNGKLKISEEFTITDDESFDSLTATDIIVHSSNVGISKIAWRLSGDQLHDGMDAFGLGRPSGIDLSRELHGKIKSARLLKYKVHSANQAYGYGMTATFAQLFKAYSAFNNNGVAVTPRIIDYFEDTNGSRFAYAPKYGDQRAISAQTANQIKTILKKVVTDGTGKQAQYPGLEIGGKTGTAHISHGHKGYSQEYHSSFYGFANDNKGHRYTLGVLVIRASKPKMYFASKSAVPTFRAMVDVLVDQGFLQPDMTAIQQKKQQEKERKRKAFIAKKQRERTRKIKAELKAQRDAIRRKQRARSRAHRQTRSSTAPIEPHTDVSPMELPKEPSGELPKKHPTPHDVLPDMF